jgi:hypothetical protein
MFPPHFVQCFEKLGVCIGLFSLSLFQTLQRLIRRTFLPAMRFQNSSFRNFQRTKCSLGCKMRGWKPPATLGSRNLYRAVATLFLPPERFVLAPRAASAQSPFGTLFRVNTHCVCGVLGERLIFFESASASSVSSKLKRKLHASALVSVFWSARKTRVWYNTIRKKE